MAIPEEKDSHRGRNLCSLWYLLREPGGGQSSWKASKSCPSRSDRTREDAAQVALLPSRVWLLGFSIREAVGWCACTNASAASASGTIERCFDCQLRDSLARKKPEFGARMADPFGVRCPDERTGRQPDVHLSTHTRLTAKSGKEHPRSIAALCYGFHR
jgi:hypothetical protein